MSNILTLYGTQFSMIDLDDILLDTVSNSIKYTGADDSFGRYDMYSIINNSIHIYIRKYERDSFNYDIIIGLGYIHDMKDNETKSEFHNRIKTEINKYIQNEVKLTDNDFEVIEIDGDE